ncbi:MAG: hypothetical protein ACREJ3_04865 [Polyangiaceae bacterium]
MIKIVVPTFALAALTILACSSSSTPSAPTPCNENPWECPAGQTCWPKDQSSFECLNSGPGQADSACESTLGAATCGDGLECLQTSQTSPGVCALYCDNTSTSHACPTGQTCQTLLLAGHVEIHVCAGGATSAGADGGHD